MIWRNLEVIEVITSNSADQWKQLELYGDTAGHKADLYIPDLQVWHRRGSCRMGFCGRNRSQLPINLIRDNKHIHQLRTLISKHCWTYV